MNRPRDETSAQKQANPSSGNRLNMAGFNSMKEKKEDTVKWEKME
jgi:hypothetical protein